MAFRSTRYIVINTMRYSFFISHRNPSLFAWSVRNRHRLDDIASRRTFRISCSIRLNIGSIACREKLCGGPYCTPPSEFACTHCDIATVGRTLRQILMGRIAECWRKVENLEKCNCRELFFRVDELLTRDAQISYTLGAFLPLIIILLNRGSGVQKAPSFNRRYYKGTGSFLAIISITKFNSNIIK